MPGWDAWGNQSEDYEPDWPTYANHSQCDKEIDKDLCNITTIRRKARNLVSQPESLEPVPIKVAA